MIHAPPVALTWRRAAEPCGAPSTWRLCLPETPLKDEDDTQLDASRRLWYAAVDDRVDALVARRVHRTLWSAAGPASACLWREVADEAPTKTRAAALRAWCRRAVLNLTADDTGCSLASLLGGCWWAAAVPRQDETPGVFSSPVCGACGRRSACLPLHLVLGGVDGEAPCPCRGAAECRAAWFQRVERLYGDHGDGDSCSALRAAPPRSFRRLALMLGWARGVELPWTLASALPRAFANTWGEWSRAALDAEDQADAPPDDDD